MIKFEDYANAIIEKENCEQLGVQRGDIYYGNDKIKLVYSYSEDDFYTGEMTIGFENGDELKPRTGRRLHVHGEDYGRLKAVAFSFFPGVIGMGGRTIDFQYSIDGCTRGTIIRVTSFFGSDKTIELRNIPARDENGVRKVKVLVFDNNGKRIEEIGVEQLTTEFIIYKLHAMLIDGTNNKEVLEGFEKVFEISKPALSLKVQDLLVNEWIREVTKPVREAQERLKEIDGQLNTLNRERAETVAYLLDKDTELDNLLYTTSINSPIKKDTTGKFIEELIKQEGMDLISGEPFGKPDLYIDKNSGQKLTIKKTEYENLSCTLGTRENGILKIFDQGNDGVDLNINLYKICACEINIKVSSSQVIVSYNYFHGGDKGKFYIDYNSHESHVGEVYSFWMTCDADKAIRYECPIVYLEDSTIEGITNLILNVCQNIILSEDDEMYGTTINAYRKRIDENFRLIKPIIRLGVSTTFMKGRVKALQKVAEDKRRSLSRIKKADKRDTVEKEIRSLESMTGDILWDIDGSRGFVKNKA